MISFSTNLLGLAFFMTRGEQTSRGCVVVTRLLPSKSTILKQPKIGLHAFERYQAGILREATRDHRIKGNGTDMLEDEGDKGFDSWWKGEDEEGCTMKGKQDARRTRQVARRAHCP